MANHSGDFIDSEKSRTGNLDHNPIHEDMLYAARTAKLAFIVNVVLDGEKHIIGSFAGDMVEAYKVGCEFVRELAHVTKIPLRHRLFQQMVVSHWTKTSTKLLKV